ncbi:spore protease YyaC [Paenibacillus alvei]|uniref:Spore protease YyaC n=2 Tax=Paenibacillus TaxID=44249 RepID=A0ABT4H1R8_PAEAL|nr:MULTISPECIES: spore protease YyaC [Paenibacillus]MCY7483596.1 spore protease YyaC [Paenibacillus alvei]MCY9762916.1 spore protease YyaC [Paenibacillus alvei]MCY9769274.1 spore protease YyaC [Paenibacillus alvei]
MQVNGKMNKVYEQSGQKIRCTIERLREWLRQVASEHQGEEVVFICIGTDRSTGDALGPLVGSRLAQSGLKVIGTMEEPCDATNLEFRISSLRKEEVTIAIDACLGHPGSVGQYLVRYSSLQPAESVGADMPAVGQYSIACVVNVNGPKPYWTLQTTSLHHVMKMADDVAGAIIESFLPQPSINPNHLPYK